MPDIQPIASTTRPPDSLASPRRGTSLLGLSLAVVTLAVYADSPESDLAQAALAEAYREQGDQVREADHNRQALAAQPDHEGLHVSMAACLYRAGDLTGAELVFRRAVDLKSDRFLALFAPGSLLARKHDRDSAEWHYRRVLQVKPEHVGLQADLALLMLRTDRLREASAIYRQLLNRQSGISSVKLQLAKIPPTLPNADETERKEAVQLTPKARQERNLAYRVFRTLEATYSASSRYGEASRTFHRSLDLAPKQAGIDVVMDLESRQECNRNRHTTGGVTPPKPRPMLSAPPRKAAQPSSVP